MSEEMWSDFDRLWQTVTAQGRQLAELERRILELERARQAELVAAALEKADRYLPLANEDDPAWPYK